jgi:hypothetical protein
VLEWLIRGKMLELLPLEDLIRVILITIGITYVLAGSVIGHLPRLVWCTVLKKIHLSYFWSIMLCPPCNSWWVGLAVGLLSGYGVAAWQCAFASCGVVATIQAIGLSIGLQAEDDYKELIK